MSLYITSLNSGSNGNCYYVGNSEEAVLVDAGLSCKETEIRMRRLELDINKVKAIFVSHEHGDHVRGLAGLSAKYALPVYVSAGTRPGCFQLKEQYVRPLLPFAKVTIGDLTVSSFPKYHDAADPQSFIISCNEITVGVFTDLGRPCAQLLAHFAKCHAAFLEANYDTEMLENGRYPYFLKNRIRGGHGHLSNAQALEVFISHRSSKLSRLLLAHLSADNNCPELVQKMFSAHAGDIAVSVASRHAETGVYHITEKQKIDTAVRKAAFVTAAQMSLFENFG